MHRSLASMVGMPVVTQQGVRMGEIRDALLDPTEHRLVAFDVEWADDQVLNRDEPLPVTDLVELTADVATVSDEIGTSRGLDRDFTVDGDGVLRALDQVVDMRVLDGKDGVIGVVADLHFDPTDGSIGFYEIMPHADPNETADAMLLTPHQALEFRDGDALVVPDAARASLQVKPAPRVDIAMMRQVGIEEPQGDEDIEVLRGRPAAEP
jgi:uncharacterized protein YrrD